MSNEVGTDTDGNTVYAWEIPRRHLLVPLMVQAFGDLAAHAYTAALALQEFSEAHRRTR